MNTIRLVAVWLAGLSIALAEGPAVVVGAVVSQTGAHAELASGYGKGLLLWQDEVNAAGGLLGRRVELRLLDDASHAVRAAALYAQLIRDEKADLLIGPYGSAATLVAAAEAERARRVMVNGAGAASVVHSRAPRYLFQSAVPYAAYGTGVLQVAGDAGYRRLFILARDDAASREMAEATRAAAAKDFSPSEIEVYRAGTSDFAPQVAKARAAQAEAWIAFGDVRDAADMVKTFRRLEYAPRLFFARGAGHPKFTALVGQDAEFSLGTQREPEPAAAEGYAAGTVLAAAVRRAGTLDQEKLRAALAALETTTVLGAYKVAAESGEQIGTKPAVVQIRKGRPAVVWPQALETAKPLLPYPQWDERSVIK